jgi:non-ribosomal peptide synthase protein (TIGR01720 family)
VGWFTTIIPVVFQVRPMSVELLKSVKQTVRSIPGKGIFHRECSKRDHLQICFNYVGRFQQFSSKSDSLFVLDQTFTMGDVSSRNNACEDILITLGHQNNKLVLLASYSNQVCSESICRWLTLWQSHMTQLIELLCSEDCQGGFTMSDFPLLPVDADIHEIQDQICNKLKVSLNDVEDIYPATALQEGFLSALSKASSEYTLQSVYSLSDVSLPRLRNAWKQVVETFEIYRTSFLLSGKAILQVVFNSGVIEWNELPGETISEYEGSLQTYLALDRDRGFFFESRCFARVTIMPIKGTSVLIRIAACDHDFDFSPFNNRRPIQLSSA